MTANFSLYSYLNQMSTPDRPTNCPRGACVVTGNNLACKRASIQAARDGCRGENPPSEHMGTRILLFVVVNAPGRTTEVLGYPSYHDLPGRKRTGRVFRPSFGPIARYKHGGPHAYIHAYHARPGVYRANRASISDGNIVFMVVASQGASLPRTGNECRRCARGNISSGCLPTQQQACLLLRHDGDINPLAGSPWRGSHRVLS